MGGEISKFLEEDTKEEMNGVISNYDSPRTEQTKRSENDVAQRQQIFSFCFNWSTDRITSMLRWYMQFDAHNSSELATRIDLSSVKDQVDVLHLTVQQEIDILDHVESELQQLDTHMGGNEDERLTLVSRTELMQRKEAVTTSLRQHQLLVQEMESHLLASFDGVDLHRIVCWAPYIKAATQVHMQEDLESHAAATKSWHPSASGYAMDKDPAAVTLFNEYSTGDTVLPPPERHEIDGFTDDSASSSAASVDESEHDSEDEEEKEDVDVENNPQTSRQKKRIVDSDEESEEDDDIIPATKPAATDDAEEKETEEGLIDESSIPDPQSASNEIQAEANELTPYLLSLKQPRVIKRKLPESIDPTIRSPIFFGYTLKKASNEMETVIQAQDAVQAQEDELFDKKVKYYYERMETNIGSERSKGQILKERKEDVEAKRQKQRQQRQNEFDRAKKELDPNDTFFRTFQAQSKRLQEQWDREDEELEQQTKKVEEKISTAQRECDELLGQIKRVRRVDEPIGRHRLEFHESEMSKLQHDMEEAKQALRIAKEEFVALQNAKSKVIGGSDAKNRSQLLFAQDQITSKEKELESICKMYDEELFLLKRGEAIYHQEQIFLPLYSCLTKSKNGEGQIRCTLLELAIALIIGSAANSLHERTQFVFRLFCNRKTTIQVLSRNAFAEILRLAVDLIIRIQDLHLPRGLTREFLLRLADREFLKLGVPTGELKAHASGQRIDGMTSLEFERYCIGTVEQSKYLCDIFHHVWQYDQLSRFVIQHMSAVHRYRLGLINMSDLQYAIAYESAHCRQQLSMYRKEVIHTRALAMGENDPLKTDYSKYLPKRHSNLLSKVVPLDHGGYRNLINFRMDMMLRAAIKLQTGWRAKRGRQMARFAAEKQAFYHARGVELQEARDTIEAEWQEKDEKPGHSVEKMRFEAKIRMRQVKLRTKGNTFSRDEVMALMREEAVQQAQKEVENRFREMEESLGYVTHKDLVEKPHADLVYLEGTVSKELVDNVVKAKEATADISIMKEMIAINETKDTKEHWEEVEEDDKVARETSLHFVDEEEREIRLEASRQRQDDMVRGRFDAIAYGKGLTRDEVGTELRLGCTDTALVDFKNRLQSMCRGLTDLKLQEMLQELPSKRHLCTYVQAFRKSDGTFDMNRLETDLFDHFRIIRGAEDLAQGFVRIFTTDMEFGVAEELMHRVLEINDSILQNLVTFQASEQTKANATMIEKKLIRMGYKKDVLAAAHIESEEKQTEEVDSMAALEHANLFELNEKRKKVDDTHKQLMEAMKAWKEAEIALLHTQKQQLKEQSKYPILSADRVKWTERFYNALRTPDSTAEEASQKYTELSNVCHDFVETARAIGMILIREYPLPLRDKSILPTTTSEVDGRKDDVRSTYRHTYECHNIRFQFCTDDHGRFENSDEYAAKYASHEIRNSALYFRHLSHVQNLLLPLQCTVDYAGFRLLCVAKLPIETITWNEAGTAIQKRTKQLLCGSDSRGKTMISQSKEMSKILEDAAGRLNLKRHSARGYQDLTSKVFHGPADMLGYATTEKGFALLQFARAMPPEDPSLTIHLPQSTRGLSILWRQLRPEFVAMNEEPLSSDALSYMTYCTPDWQEQASGVEKATKYLLGDVLHNFAVKLSQKERYFTSEAFYLTTELHRHGINVRHLGLLRSKFVFQLTGTVTLQYGTAEVASTDDFTREVERGGPIIIHGKQFKVSMSRRHRFDATCITLDRVHPDHSEQNVDIYSGWLECQQHAADIRLLILAEIAVRTFKNILRHFLRSTSKMVGAGFTAGLHAKLIVYCLNLLCGSGDISEWFWTTHMYVGIRQRFGVRSISEVEKPSLRRTLVPKMRYMIDRLVSMTGIKLQSKCLERLSLLPDSYTFIADDLLDGDYCHIKHNLSMLHFSMASLLLLQAVVKQATSYSDLIVSHKPSGYWTLCERRGTLIAANMGTYSKDWIGDFLPGCRLEADGPVCNVAFNRAVQLDKKNRSYVRFKYIDRFYPTSPDAKVSVEAWCKCDGHESTRRVAVTVGRYSLSALKSNRWAFSGSFKDIDLSAKGPRVVFGKWVYLVGTFDGTIMRFYADGYLCHELEVDAVVDQALAKREAMIQKKRDDINQLEDDAKALCFKDVESEMQTYFVTKEGKKNIKAMSQKLCEEHKFRSRLSQGSVASAAEDSRLQTKQKAKTMKDLSKVSYLDFEPLAKKQSIRSEYEERLKVVVKEYEEMRNRVNLEIENDLAEQATQGNRPLRIGCLSSARRKDGKRFFHGCIAHVAYYNGHTLSHDEINSHFVMGTRDRANESDYFFSLSASRFQQALSFAPDDKLMLRKFADNICASLKYDLDQQYAQNMYKKKVRCGLVPLLTSENVHGIAEILKSLPRDIAFSDLFIHCYRSVLEMDSQYFQATESDQCRLSLPDLARMPLDFFFGSQTAYSLGCLKCDDKDDIESTEESMLHVFTDVVCRVLEVFPTYYGDELTNLSWVRSLQNQKAIAYFILASESGEDPRCIDLKHVLDINDHDFEIIARNNTFCTSLKANNCRLLSDEGIGRAFQSLSHVEELELSYCDQLGDTAFQYIGRVCTKLQRVWLAHCYNLTDTGIEALARSNAKLRELGLSYCSHVTDYTLLFLAKYVRKLHTLDVEMCVQIRSTGVEGMLKKMQDPSTLLKLNFSGCQRLDDIALLNVALHCPELRHLNVNKCEKLTDKSLKRITHNCVKINTLLAEDVMSISSTSFMFDQVNDGRDIVDRKMLTNIIELSVAGGASIDDVLLGHVGHRARRLKSINISRCSGVTDQGLRWLFCDNLSGKPTDISLEAVDLSFCLQLSADGIKAVVMKCTDVTTVKLAGCSYLTDENVADIVQTCSKLIRLDISFCRNLTDVALESIAKHLWLEELNLARCIKISDKGLLSIVAQAEALQSLNLSSCKKLTSQSFQAIYDRLKLLSTLDVTHCPHFTSDDMAQFQRRRVDVYCTPHDSKDLEASKDEAMVGSNNQQQVEGNAEHTDSEQDMNKKAHIKKNAYRNSSLYRRLAESRKKSTTLPPIRKQAQPEDTT